MKRRFSLIIFGITALALVVLLSAQLALASATVSDTPAQTVAAYATNLSGTTSAAKAKLAATLTAAKQDIAGTATAIHQNIAGTATAIKQDISATATAIRGDISGTVTAISGTIDAYRTDIPATVTALVATVTAVRADIAGTATAFGGTVAAIKSTLALTKVPGSEASVVLTNYAIQTFGSAPVLVKAGGTDFKVDGTYPVPVIITNAQSVAANLTVQLYVGQTANGSLWLANGTGTLTNPANGKSADVQSSSLGVYNQNVASNGTLNATSALALAKATYPTLAGYAYTPLKVSQGFAYYSSSYTYVVDPTTQQLTLTPMTVVLSVVPGKNGQAIVTAAVGTGVYSTTLHP